MSEPYDPSESELLDHNGDSQADDARLLRLLLAFSDGRVEDFADALSPPTGVRSFIRRADRHIPQPIWKRSASVFSASTRAISRSMISNRIGAQDCLEVLPSLTLPARLSFIICLLVLH